MLDIQQLLTGLASTRSDSSPKIICFYTGSRIPPSCEPMIRRPAPPIDVSLDENLTRIIRRATAKNRSLHDVALMIGRNTRKSEYTVTGWSYRLFPPHHSDLTQPN